MRREAISMRREAISMMREAISDHSVATRGN